MNIRRCVLALSSLAVLLIMSMPLSGATVAGEFAPGGTSVRVSNIDILFYHLPGFVPPVCPGTGLPNACSAPDATGNLVVQPPTTGAFAGRAGETATVKSLTRHPTAEPNLAFAPTDKALAIFDWLVLPNTPSITFELTRLVSGLTASAGTAPICNPANWNIAGYRCLPDAGSSFLLTNVQTFPGGPINTNISMNALAFSWFTATPFEKSFAELSFVSTLANHTIGDVFGELASTGYVESSLGGSIVIPQFPAEPATLMLSGVALVAIVLLSLRKTMKSVNAAAWTRGGA